MRRMPTLLGIDSLLFFKSLENPFVAILSFALKKSNSGIWQEFWGKGKDSIYMGIECT